MAKIPTIAAVTLLALAACAKDAPAPAPAPAPQAPTKPVAVDTICEVVPGSIMTPGILYYIYSDGHREPGGQC